MIQKLEGHKFSFDQNIQKKTVDILKIFPNFKHDSFNQMEV